MKNQEAVEILNKTITWIDALIEHFGSEEVLKHMPNNFAGRLALGRLRLYMEQGNVEAGKVAFLPNGITVEFWNNDYGVTVRSSVRPAYPQHFNYKNVQAAVEAFGRIWRAVDIDYEIRELTDDDILPAQQRAKNSG